MTTKKTALNDPHAFTACGSTSELPAVRATPLSVDEGTGSKGIVGEDPSGRGTARVTPTVRSWAKGEALLSTEADLCDEARRAAPS